MSTEWITIAAIIIVSTGLTILVGYGIRYVVRGLAGTDRASFGAFCFMLGAVLVRDDVDARATEDVCRFIGGCLALIVLYRHWFGGGSRSAER